MIPSGCSYDSVDKDKDTVVEPGNVIDQLQHVENDQPFQAEQNLLYIAQPQLEAEYILNDNIL